ncbi:MAG: hypothetical protein U9Q27_03485 [Patescibacteria group bacterium]|nr:hypothetical protein [Patescibacteria group bacterium]
MDQRLKLRIQNLENFIQAQFTSRTTIETKRSGEQHNITLNTKLEKHTLWLTFLNKNEAYTVTIPMPFIEKGILLISQNEVERALCTYFFEETQRKVDYLSAIYHIICDNPRGLVSNRLIRKSPFIQQIIYSFGNGNSSIIIYNLQRAINEVANRMPLHETSLNSWVMNHRLLIIDPQFDFLRNPKDLLQYQIDKATKYFDLNWTSLGLSDGSLANKNYILTTDIRYLTPFGLKYHNPGRNLYSTLQMCGEELPLVRSESMQKLMNQGINRTGWNWFTVFADIPDNFEDQIMVDESHIGIPLEYKKRIQCFGKLLIKEGESLKYGQKIGILHDKEASYFKTIADKAIVKKITETVTNIGNNPTKVFNIIIKYTRKLKEGFKITNTHGNKGVIRFTKLGYAINPKTGNKQKIDVIVSAKSIKKRKNYGQIFEALLNNINDGIEVVLPDNFNQSMSEIYVGLEKHGFRRDGTWDCNTYAGKFKSICGLVFWGVIKTVENSLWNKDITIKKNNKGLRTSGLKFSTVEIRALETRFGPNNPIIEEILSYGQGTENLHEQLSVMKSKKGILPNNKPIIDVKNVKPADQSKSTIMDKKAISNTVVDENYFKDGFILQLPITYQVLIDKSGKVTHEGIPQIIEDNSLFNEIIHFNKIYIPSTILRKCWCHSTGKYGLSEIGILVNNLVVFSHKYIADSSKTINLTFLYQMIYKYINRITAIMSTKRGDLSTYGMSIRYPLSSRAKATLSNNLPKNTVEIYKEMANELYIKSGDVVLIERFPCLGFMTIRPQKVKVTNDPQCKYVIRVSKNSLISLDLDFDGDDLFIASFHDPKSKTLLNNEHTNPNKTCYNAIQILNQNSGKPHLQGMNLYDYKIEPFKPLTKETHANYVGSLTGVKAQTGPVVALAYNIMRIIENSGLKKNRKLDVGIELFLNKIANSVFAQKHGKKSLHEIVTDATCTGDVNALVKKGFNRGVTTIICDIISKKAKVLGIFNLIEYHEKIKEYGGSNIISRIVRSENRIYYASRASLECIEFLEHLKSPVVDTPSKLFKWIISGENKNIKTQLEKLSDKTKISIIRNQKYKDACITMCEYIEKSLSSNKIRMLKYTKQEFENR